MSGRTFFLTSSIGSKLVMALSGLLLAGFVVGHLAGNLLIYVGRDAFNTYAEGLKGLGAGLWVIRLGLLSIFLVHIFTGIRLRGQNRAARPVPYAHEATVQASFASRSMILSGMLLLAFVVFHLMHYTVGVVDPSTFHPVDTFVRGGEEVSRHDAYGMAVAGFEQPLFTLVYVISMVILGLHLSHGLSSLFQSLGFRHGRYSACLEKAAPLFAWILAIGFISIPVAVLTGIVGAGIPGN